MRAFLLFGVLAIACVACGGAPAVAPAEATAAKTCAVPVKLGNQTRFSTTAMEARAVRAAHDVLEAEHACGRAYQISFAADPTEEELNAVKVELHVSVAENGALVATSSVTLRIPKPVTDEDAAAAIAKASTVLTRQVVAKVR